MEIDIKEVNKEISDSLSNVEMKDFLDKHNKQANIYTYEELSRFNHLDELLKPHDRCVILYETSTEPIYGHWCCLFKNAIPGMDGQIINFFDSYGYKPDSELNWKSIPEYVRKVSGEDHTHLLYLLNKYLEQYPDIEIYYNPYDFQEKKKGVSTCGRHVLSRLLLQNLDTDQYKHFIDKSCKIVGKELNQKINPDQLVTIFTM